MSSFSIFSIPFILSLPAPFKVLLVMLGGFSWLGFRAVEVKQAEVEMRAVQAAPVAPPADAAPELIAPKVAAKPVKPVAEPAAPREVVVAPVIVTLKADGELTLDGRKVGQRALVNLLGVLTKANAEQKVIVTAGGNVPMKQVTEIMDLCQSAGISDVTFIKQVPVPKADETEAP
ncbi:biopolymer transporter ExbD [Verrucomicrobiaceae bacterium R5-34]|uniref:Biopolymer transporter ExbD n=1 Tax=Oceaniferula flava TaxID=2800421 RepID=A0AAE2VA47_9BACT|nr:biopolymer transporter ExbD [Oceaniferula flavus]MBK1829819.1 biopolymer transporter ExbD [Verrucomicrobiaceae bacterium R5-34]MBK1856288.1 biopolymer transporter ExbD [Oceaniferula flavus]MBM1137595.1 biopolymer transporter ExbD [Oceaniferula flavus]